MARREPHAFPLPDRRVYDYYIASRTSAALVAGVRLGLFDLLDRAPRSAAQIAAELEVSERGARALLAAVGAMGLVEETDGRWTLAPDAAAYAVRDRPGSLAGLIDLEVENFLSPAALLEALRSGGPSVYGGGDPWEHHAADPQRARAFTAAMHSVSERPAAGLAEVVELRGGERLLDVGGGSGALSLALARAHPEVHCSVYDLEAVRPLAEEYIAAAGLGERVTVAVGDMFTEELPTDHDVVLLSQILHDWAPERGAELCAKAWRALRPGGRILIHEKLVDEEGRGPLANALVHLDMLVWTEGQQYRASELEALLEEAGFAAIETRPTTGYWSVVSGEKP